MEQTKYDVFISYSRKDTAVADAIIAAFEDAGITYFIDRQGIGGGIEFPAVLSKAIRESTVFLFLASKNSYQSKFTQSEIVYAFNKKQKQDIIPYIIDGSKMPEELEFTFSAINWRNIKEHPIETTLVNDVLLKIGKTRNKSDNTDSDGTFVAKGETKGDGVVHGFKFTGKTLAYIILSLAIISVLGAIIVSKEFILDHYNTLENVLCIMILASFLLTLIGYIRPASVCLASRKVVSQFYLSSMLVFFFAFSIIVGSIYSANEPMEIVGDTIQIVRDRIN